MLHYHVTFMLHYHSDEHIIVSRRTYMQKYMPTYTHN